MRTFLTSLANLEISYLEENCHVPNGVVSYEEGGHLIQEGADNVDINTETIDGKNTFHSMARAIFQLQENTTNTKLSCVKVVRGHTRSLNLDDAKTVFLLESQNSVMDHRVVKKCKNEVITLSLIKKTKDLRIDVGISSSACTAKCSTHSNSCTIQKTNCSILDRSLRTFFKELF